MDDNWRTAVGYICIALVFITMYLGAAWVMSPSEFTFKIEMDNNTKDAVESIDYESITDMPVYINLWIAPSENWTMVTYTNDELFINGEKAGRFEEPLFEVGIWNRTKRDAYEVDHE